jgi:hypothetical protein
MRSASLALRVTASLALLVTTSLAAQTPAPVTGTLTVNTTTVKLNSASAFSHPGGTGGQVSVLLSDKPANPKSFAEYTRIGAGEHYRWATFMQAWSTIHADGGLSGLTFSVAVDARNQVDQNYFLVGGLKQMFGLSPDDLVLEVTSVSPRFTGRIRTKQPTLDLGTRKVSLDATFDIPTATPGK